MQRLIAPLLFGLAGTAILVWLGTWQIQRLAWKEGVLAEIESTIAADPAPLPRMIAPAEQRYQPVTLSGVIEPGELHVLVSVKRVGAGYRVVSPYQTEDGRRVLLDRGFVPVDQKAAPRQTGPAQIDGNLHWPDDRNSSTPDNDITGNTWFARDIAAMAEVLQTEPLLVIARNVSPNDPAVTPLPVDTSGIPNDHLQYAITWFSLAAIWVIMTLFFIRRQSRDRQGL
ncbi:MAG: SURF1 family protein [Paracoccaceae bacterium]|nr:SURF1 family protein [Paracoccaceae bacterium]